VSNEAKTDLECWEVIHRQQVVDASPWLRLWVETVRLPDGRVVDDFYVLDLPGFVVVTAVTQDDEILVERQYKHGMRKIVLALPAGYIEDDETPLVAAKRELLEETGYGGGDWQALGSFVKDGNRKGGTAHLFLAQGVERKAEPNDDDLEERQVLQLTPSRFLQAIRTGDVAGLPSLAAFLLTMEQLETR
jgi:ADP-ribose pyrophosphatase